jgi:hypothetical protein
MSKKKVLWVVSLTVSGRRASGSPIYILSVDRGHVNNEETLEEMTQDMVREAVKRSLLPSLAPGELGEPFQKVSIDITIEREEANLYGK